MSSHISTEEIKKIGIALDTLGDFNKNNEDRIIKICNKTSYMANRIKTLSSDDLSRAQRVIQRHTESLQREWPALFGAIPDKMYIHIS